jgi:ADP-ribose pyrophosphatase
MEETGISIRAGDPVYAFDFMEHDDGGNLRFHYVVVDLLADYVSGEPRGADDALEARWLSWDELKTLPVSKNTVRLLRKIDFDRSSGTVL